MKVRVAILLSLVVLVSLPASAQTSPIVPAKVWKAFENEINVRTCSEILATCEPLQSFTVPLGHDNQYSSKRQFIRQKSKLSGFGSCQ